MGKRCERCGLAPTTVSEMEQQLRLGGCYHCTPEPTWKPRANRPAASREGARKKSKVERTLFEKGESDVE